MTNRVHNFSAGPSALPLEVLQEAAENLVEHPPFGMSIMEMSHRSKGWVERQKTVEAELRTLANISDDYEVLFLQGGATTQFAMVPQNLLTPGDKADYILTGTWSNKALAEAQKLGFTARACASNQETNYDRTPTTFDIDPNAAYVHYTSNNTIYGTQWNAPPPSQGRPLVCDASSDIFCRPLALDQHDLIYAGAQKNIGPAGVTLVIVRRDLLDRAPKNLPTMMTYRTHAAKNSAHNTPPVWCIYMIGLVVRWLTKQGGLAAVEVANRRKAALLYDLFSQGDFYKGHAQPDSRSLMNVTFRLPTQELDAMFIAEADRAGLKNLKGHRSTGGCRASIYNAVPETSVQALVDFMRDFETRRG